MSQRKNELFVFGMIGAFVIAVQRGGFYDASITFSLALVVYSFFDRYYMMNLLLVEYMITVIYQLIMLGLEHPLIMENKTVLRLFLHALGVFLIYLGCMRSIQLRSSANESIDLKEKQLKSHETDVEDFLSNISHELRTPVNVVIGMSDFLIRSGAGKEAESIKYAGNRLTDQIEDIQDYTECKRRSVLIEQEDYRFTSLLNEVVQAFRSSSIGNNLQLVVDLDPAVPSLLRGDVKKWKKIFRHLVENAIKFTRQGGIYIKVTSDNTNYGVNLCVEVTDTGIGMDRQEISFASKGLYQADKKRDRSADGIGLGLSIVYGFVTEMGGFVKIESDKGIGTTVRLTVPQLVVNPQPCLHLDKPCSKDIILHLNAEKYRVARVRDFYRSMAMDLAAAMRLRLYTAETKDEIEKIRKKADVGYIFMGAEEYRDNHEYFDLLSHEDIVVTVAAPEGFSPSEGSEVIIMPRPLYANPVIRILNEGKNVKKEELEGQREKPDLSGIRALVVDDDPMNLVVAKGIFSEYGMITETAKSGREGIARFRQGDIDIVFMDHMMPEMDGVEAMKRIRDVSREIRKKVYIVALTANVVSGAREMFMREGFDGFIGKPIDIDIFERVMHGLFGNKDDDQLGGEL